MLKRTALRAILGLTAVLACGLPATSAPITSATQTAVIPLTQTDWTPGNFSGGVNPLNFTKFDPKLGKLEAVNLSVAYTFNHSVTMTFTNAATITVTGNSNTISIGRPDGTAADTVAVPDYSVTQSYNGPTFPHTITLPTQTTTGTAPLKSLTSAADLALFTQSSPTDTLIKLPVSATARSTFGVGNGNGGGGAQVYAGANATLTYTYEPSTATVPEPSTLAAFGLGLGGYLLARRNRRSAAL